MTGFLVLVTWTGSRALLLPLILAAVAALPSIDRRAVGHALLSPINWIAASSAALLVLSVLHLGDFLIVEKTIQVAGHQDTLFHASVASMIKTYGIVTTGLNGVAVLPYHVLSHRLLAALSVLSGIGVLEVYGISEIVLLSPLLVLGLSWAVLKLCDRTGVNGAGAAWLATTGILALMKVLPLERWAVWDAYFISESFTVSLTLFAFAVPSLLRPDTGVSAFAAAGALIVLAGLSKGSVGLLGVGLLAIRAVQERASRPSFMAIAAAAAALVAYALAAPAHGASTAMTFAPFFTAQTYAWWGGYIRESVEGFRLGRVPAAATMLRAAIAVTVFVAVSFAWSWAVIGRRIASDGIRGVWRHADAAASVAAIALGLAVLQFRIPGGAYFVEQALFVSLPVVAAGVAAWLHHAGHMRAVAAVAILLASAWPAWDGYRTRPHGPVFMKDRAFVDRLENRGRGGHIEALLALRGRWSDDAVVLEASPSFPNPVPIWDCFLVPFTYPALSERAWVGVLDASGACKYTNYGYPVFFTGTPPALAPAILPRNGRIVRVPGS